MKAIQIEKYGHADVLEVVEIEKPKAGKGQVLIEAYASCINPVDTMIREGYMAKMMPVTFPATLGSDVAGVVVEVGEGVENFKVGDKVYGSGIVLAGATGAFAEFVASPGIVIAKMPNNVNFNEAAAVVLTGVSAVQALLEHIKLRAGQKILIHGGSGGIGTVAIQIAKKIGAYVATTATGEGIEYVKNLGADEVIDYQHQQFDQMLSGYDAVFDTVGAQTYDRSFKVLKKGGIIVSMIAPINEALAEQYGIIAISQFTKVTTEHLNILTQFIEQGDAKVHIDKMYPLDKIQEAFEAKEKGDVKGKIVIEIKK
jgi:alcohol dehydrogenase